MLIYDLENRGARPIYEYLYLCIRRDILSGLLKPGDKLPSKREMARDHHIALITVENAYAQLMIEGYVTSREKSGYFVSGDVPAEGISLQPDLKRDSKTDLKADAWQDIKAKQRSGTWQNAVEERKLDASRKVNDRPVGEQNGPKTELLADFTSGRLKHDAFPFATWTKLMRKVLDDREEAFLQKPESAGILELREAIAVYLQKAKGLNVSADRIIVGPGTEYLHHIIVQLIGKNRMVAVEDPGYIKVGQIYEGDGLKCLHIPVDEGGMMIERLKESNVGLVHISPSHHFPTGCVMPIGRRKALLLWASERNTYIVEDDYDSEFRFDGRPVPTLASLSDENVIYMNTFTKTLAPSIRMAYMVLPERLRQKYQEKLSFYSGAVSSFEQYTLAAFIAEGYYERHINRMRNYYRQQRTIILQALNESPLASRVSVEEHSAGLHFILKVKGLRNDEKWLEKLRTQGIKLMPVSSYCYGDQEKYRHQFVVYYSNLEQKNLEKALAIMATCVKRDGSF